MKNIKILNFIKIYIFFSFISYKKIKMQSQKKKKKQKNKKDSQIIEPIKHEKFGNLNNYSEDIVKEIIDKIISLSITEVFTTKINSKINEFCFQTIQRYLNLTIFLMNINHDRDNLYDLENISKEKKRSNSDEKKYKIKNHLKCNKIRNKNAENDMFEITDINRDFEAEMILKNKDIDDFLNKTIDFEGILDKKKLSKTNFWGDISQPITYGPQRIASKSNALKKNIIIDKNNIINIQNIPKSMIKSVTNTPKRKSGAHFSSTQLLSNSQNQITKSPKDEEINTQKLVSLKAFEARQRKFLLLDMEDMKEIEEKVTKREEPEEIKQLRKLKLEEIQLLKEEEKRAKYTRKISQNDLNFNYDLDSINLTAFERAKNIKTQKKIIENEIKKGNFTYDFNNKIILIRQLKPDSLLEDFPVAITKSKEKINSMPKNIARKKTNDDTIEIIDILNDKEKMKNIVEEKNYVPNYYNFNFNFNTKITPSGSNFEKIKPEIGVNIYEGDEIKTGGKEFFEKYKRFSLKDYTKMLQELNDSQIKKSYKEEENKNLENLNLKKDKINSANEISKMKKNFGIMNQRMKNFKLKAPNAPNTKRSMSKSQSQLFTIDKTLLYKNLLEHDDKKEKENYKKKFKKHDDDLVDKFNQSNLFLRRLKNIMNIKNNESYSFKLIDSFNKSIIIRGANNETKKKEEDEKNKDKDKNKNKKGYVLPIIPLKQNKSVIFTRKEQFLRTRIKKSNED